MNLVRSYTLVILGLVGLCNCTLGDRGPLDARRCDGEGQCPPGKTCIRGYCQPVEVQGDDSDGPDTTLDEPDSTEPDEPDTVSDGSDLTGDGTSDPDVDGDPDLHQCSDQIDNDDDGFTDMDDPDCTSPSDDNERCEPAYTPHGYCPAMTRLEGLWIADYRTNWICTCQDPPEVSPDCCRVMNTVERYSEEDPTLGGHVTITASSTQTGFLMVHSTYEAWRTGYPPGESILVGPYVVDDEDTLTLIGHGAMRSYYEGIEDFVPLYQIIFRIEIIRQEGDTLQIEAYGQNPDAMWEYLHAFDMELHRVGSADDCVDDQPQLALSWGHCYPDGQCQSLLSGCTAEVVCAWYNLEEQDSSECGWKTLSDNQCHALAE